MKTIQYEYRKGFEKGYVVGYMCGAWEGHYTFLSIIRDIPTKKLASRIASAMNESTRQIGLMNNLL